MIPNATTTDQPTRPALFSVGQLVTCPGPFNSGRDDQGYWRRVERVVDVRWDPPIPGFRGRLTFGFWRVAVPGYSAPELNYAPAPAGAKVGDIVRFGN